MISPLMLLASLSLAVVDASYDDLGFANISDPAECKAQFDRGRIEVVQAFNEIDRTMINAAIITGKPTKPLPLGSRLWIKSTYGSAWRALVVESSQEKVKIATNARFIGDLFANDTMSVELYRTTDGVSFRDAVLVDYVYDHSNIRQKLAEMMDCGDGLGI